MATSPRSSTESSKAPLLGDVPAAREQSAGAAATEATDGFVDVAQSLEVARNNAKNAKSRRPPRPSRRASDAKFRDMLKQKLQKGDITAEEYKRIVSVIERAQDMPGSRPPHASAPAGAPPPPPGAVVAGDSPVLVSGVPAPDLPPPKVLSKDWVKIEGTEGEAANGAPVQPVTTRSPVSVKKRRKGRYAGLRFFDWREALCSDDWRDPTVFSASIGRTRRVWGALAARSRVTDDELLFCQRRRGDAQQHSDGAKPKEEFEISPDRRALLHSVYIDIERTRQSDDYFAMLATRRLMVDLLVVYVSSKPGRCYHQGMNELLAVLLLALRRDHRNVEEITKRKSAKKDLVRTSGLTEDLLHLVDSRFLAADSYALFCGLMRHVARWYGIPKEPVAPPGRAEFLLASQEELRRAGIAIDGSARTGEASGGDDNVKRRTSGDSVGDESIDHTPPDDSDVTSQKVGDAGTTLAGETSESRGKSRRARRPRSESLALLERFDKVQYKLLRRFDPKLCEDINAAGLVPQMYLLRWMRVLLARELPKQQLLRAWDAMLLSQPPLGILDYICVAMLISARRLILETQDIMKLGILLRYPPVEEFRPIIRFARRLGRGDFKARPSDAYHYAPILRKDSADSKHELSDSPGLAKSIFRIFFSAGTTTPKKKQPSSAEGTPASRRSPILRTPGSKRDRTRASPSARSEESQQPASPPPPSPETIGRRESWLRPRLDSYIQPKSSRNLARYSEMSGILTVNGPEPTSSASLWSPQPRQVWLRLSEYELIYMAGSASPGTAELVWSLPRVFDLAKCELEAQGRRCLCIMKRQDSLPSTLISGASNGAASGADTPVEELLQPVRTALLVASSSQERDAWFAALKLAAVAQRERLLDGVGSDDTDA